MTTLFTIALFLVIANCVLQGIIVPFYRDKIAYELDDLKDEIAAISKKKKVSDDQIKLSNAIIDEAVNIVPELTISKIIGREKSENNIFQMITDSDLKEVMDKAIQKLVFAMLVNNSFLILIQLPFSLLTGAIILIIRFFKTAKENIAYTITAENRELSNIALTS